MQLKFSKQTFERRIRESAPVFYKFIKDRKLYRTLSDVMFIKAQGDDEVRVVTCHSDRLPFDYYIWDKYGEIYIPRPISELQLANLEMIPSRKLKKSNRTETSKNYNQ